MAGVNFVMQNFFESDRPATKESVLRQSKEPSAEESELLHSYVPTHKPKDLSHGNREYYPELFGRLMNVAENTYGSDILPAKTNADDRTRGLVLRCGDAEKHGR